MDIECEFESCVFQRDGFCMKGWIHISRSGACTDCIPATVKNLKAAKARTLKELEEQYHAEDLQQKEKA